MHYPKILRQLYGFLLKMESFGGVILNSVSIYMTTYKVYLNLLLSVFYMYMEPYTVYMLGYLLKIDVTL